jgi:hypothetical protein
MIYKGGNVKDGRGEKIKRENAPYLKVVGHFTARYRASNCHTTKREIASKVYEIIARSGALFVDCKNKVKSKEESIQKIMKSLKDYKKRSRITKPAQLDFSLTDIATVSSAENDDWFGTPLSMPTDAVPQKISFTTDSNESLLNYGCPAERTSFPPNDVGSFDDLAAFERYSDNLNAPLQDLDDNNFFLVDQPQYIWEHDLTLNEVSETCLI